MRELRYENALKEICEELRQIQTDKMNWLERKMERICRSVLPVDYLMQLDQRYGKR